MESIRFVKKEEMNELLELYKYLHSNDLPLPPNEKLETIWEELMSNPLLRYFVLVFDRKFVSSCALSIIPNLTRGARPYALIENVVTHEKFRRNGYATKVLKNALEYAWKNQCYKVMLLTGSKNQGIHEFYEKVGFRKDIKIGFHAQNRNLDY